MLLVYTETQIENSNKTSVENLSHIKSKGVDANDLRNSIDEKPKDEATEANPYKMQIVWARVIIFLIMHMGALYAIYSGIFKAKFLTSFYGLFMVYFTASSITVGAHRFYSHRSFKANKYVRLFLISVQAMTAQRCMWTWVRDHRLHHKYSDTNADPHNSRRGFFFSHIGWLMVSRHPEVIEKGQTINMSDMDQDPMVMFQKKHYLKLLLIIGIILPTLLPYLLWKETLWNSFFIGSVFRIVGCWHITWIVNSASHIYGSRPYNKDIAPTENTFASFLSWGDGSHNYHHSFPWDYRGGEHINAGTKIINSWLRKGWAYDPKYASEELVKRYTINKGDGSHSVYTRLNPNGGVSQ